MKESLLIQNKLNKIKELLNKEIKISGILYFFVSMFYIYISVFIFLLGWIKPIYSIITISALSFAIYLYYKSSKNEMKHICIQLKMLLVVALTVIILGVLLGWTGNFTQTSDWAKHNAILFDLTDKSWPVYYQNENEHSMLTYYIGQYIFPAFIGNLFSSPATTQMVHGIWAMFGLFIGILGIFKITSSNTLDKQSVALIVALLFSVCMPLSQSIGQLILPEKISHSGHWLVFYDDYKIQLSSNIVLLRWVMPQCIIPLIVLTILYDDPYNIKNYAVLCLPVMFYSTFPFMSLIIFLITLAIINLIKNKDFIKTLKDIFSISNIITISTFGFILLAYLYGNVLSEKTDNIGFSFVNYSNENIYILILFVLSFIPYTIILFKDNKKNPFYYIATVLLLILPFFRLGLYNDLLMRTSIIPLFIYMILCIKKLNDESSKKITKIILCLFLLIGMHSSMNELFNSFKLNSYRNFPSLEIYANRNLDISDDVKYNYYSYDLENNFFYNYLARKK